MDLKIKKVLNQIESNGFEAYIVGGFVRDNILGIESTDIDICTNALPKDIIKIFNIKGENPSYGSISLKSGVYNFDITTYRVESDYENRKPRKVEYVNNLLSDIVRRDFTINSLCMNSNGDIIDLLDGKKDITNKTIRVIGDTNEKLLEDPLRMLRAIRFSTILSFDLDKEIISFIHKNKGLIKSLSYNRRKEELEKIISNKNALYGLNLIKELDLFDELEIKYDKIVFVPDILGMWAQINFSSNYPFMKSSIKTIKDIRKILDSGEIDNKTIFNYDLYTSIVAGEILGISREVINKMYHNLPIKSSKELVINSLDIINILDITPSKRVGVIYNYVVQNVLSGELLNNEEMIRKYLLENWK